jgi:hypothetical protein
MDVIINWFILIIIFVFDPLAVALVIAFNNAIKVDRGIVDKQKIIRKRELYDEEPEEEEIDDSDAEEWDEDHALDLVMNDMVKDFTEEDIQKIIDTNEEEIEPNEDLKEATSSYKEFINPIDNLKKDTSRRGVDIDGDGTIDGYDNTGDGLIDEPRPASSKRAQYVMNEKPFYARPNFNWGDRSKWINNQNAVNYWLTYIKNEKDTNYPDNFDSKTY